MRKKRVLFVSEASYLSTGYATYSRNVLNYLFSTNKYDLAELSVYGNENDPRRSSIPWKNYPNVPLPDDEHANEVYRSHHANQFGAWRFERACLDFEPDIVLSIRDFWMDSFIYHSPFRRLFKLCWMPTVDGAPQNAEWIHQFAKADYVLTYSQWANKILEDQSGGNINLCGVASPAASEDFLPKSKPDARISLNLPRDANIIGTVMRNQRRKLFPVLLEAFSKYIHRNNLDNTYLYCHTSYPDGGWDLPELLNRYHIANKVFFSYVCTECDYVESSLFNDAKKVCSRCEKYASVPCNVGTGVDDSTLSNIYNSFDLYVQCANCEGFGLPQVEAAACGIPIACTNYSAMEDVVHTLNAFPITVQAFYKELETGCERAVPSIESLIEIFTNFFQHTGEERHLLGMKTRSLYEQNYGWDKTSAVWEKVIDSCDYADWKSTPPVIKPMVDIDFNGMTNRDFIKACVSTYLIDQSRLHSHEMRCLLRDLNNGFYKPTPDGFFAQDMSPFVLNRGHTVPISKPDILKNFQQKLEVSNIWESARMDRSKLRRESWLD